MYWEVIRVTEKTDQRKRDQDVREICNFKYGGPRGLIENTVFEQTLRGEGVNKPHRYLGQEYCKHREQLIQRLWGRHNLASL